MGVWGFSGEMHAGMEMISTELGFELLRESLETCRSLCSSRTADSSSGLHSLCSRSTTLFMRSFFRPLLLLPILESRRRSSVTRKASSITCRTGELLMNFTSQSVYIVINKDTFMMNKATSIVILLVDAFQCGFIFCKDTLRF